MKRGSPAKMLSIAPAKPKNRFHGLMRKREGKEFPLYFNMDVRFGEIISAQKWLS
ncbi:hypothetical protein GCM10007416_30790 [Kroppenstedtia guangzhouensis]|uniref:Uncharacterized protein n=1 Tax=Kroppenstedtia guangzhouensis TaxID=1274356 RepID=A0ABQ1H2J6_9BACL|nr:hypothetical protein GCM10007416_30790 [Kroppenstedtia guangzhouensis]